MVHLAIGMPIIARVSTAGTMFARSSTKSMLPVSIFSLMLARTISSMNGVQRLTAAGGQVRVEQGPKLVMLGVVHLQDAAADTRGAIHRRDGDTLVSLALSVDVVIGGHVRRSGEREHLLAAGGHPVATVGLGPRHRALRLHLLRDRQEVVAVVGGVAVEIEPVRLAVVVRDDVVNAHGRCPLLHVELGISERQIRRW